jgi:hypothetical protein
MYKIVRNMSRMRFGFSKKIPTSQVQSDISTIHFANETVLAQPQMPGGEFATVTPRFKQ